MDVFGHEPFDELSMTLSVRCGTLNLTLGELRNLAPGAVLGLPVTRRAWPACITATGRSGRAVGGSRRAPGLAIVRVMFGR
jgi:hypothetical protein